MKVHNKNLREQNTELNDRKYLKTNKAVKSQNRNNPTKLKDVNKEIYVELSDTSDYKKYKNKLIATSRLPVSKKLPEMNTLNKKSLSRVKTNGTLLKHINPPSKNNAKVHYRNKVDHDISKNESSSQEDSDSEPNFGKRKLPIRYTRATRYFNLLDIIKNGRSIRPIMGEEFLYGKKIWEESESDHDWDPKAIYGENANSILKCLQSESESNSEEEEEEEEQDEEDEEEQEDTPSTSLEVNGESNVNSKRSSKSKPMPNLTQKKYHPKLQ